MFVSCFRILGLLLVGCGLPALLHAQNRIGTGPVVDSYNQHCAVCHGADFNDGLGGSLLEDWDYVSSEQSVEDIIRNGLVSLGMNGFGSVLSDKDIRALAVLVEEKRLQSRNAGLQFPDSEDAVFKTEHHAFTLEKVTSSDEDIFWGVDFLPDGRILLTEKDGALRIYDPTTQTLGTAIAGTPEVWAHGQGGLLDVGVHPDYLNKDNGWIYLSYNKKLKSEDGKNDGFTTVVRGRIQDNQWVDQETLFEIDPKFAGGAGVHFGSRFVFKDGYLFFGVGDRGNQNQAQELTRPNGKIHRIHDDGRIPEDNPFRSTPEAYPTIWAYGNRNPQGLTGHPVTGALWESEHGPRGGDEVNVIEPGKNYGWPVITYGMNYGGTPITSETSRKGMEQPANYFTPSIAICGIDFYDGDRFPQWKNNLFVGGLASQEIWRLTTEGSQVTSRELILKNQGRVRDIASGPDGHLYVILNRGKRHGPGWLFRLVPSEES
jgi:glucose/arabinose dehydrogenase